MLLGLLPFLLCNISYVISSSAFAYFSLRKIHPQSPVVVDVKTLKAHNSTIENLKEALKAEDYEWESMYPGNYAVFASVFLSVFLLSHHNFRSKCLYYRVHYRSHASIEREHSRGSFWHVSFS